MIYVSIIFFIYIITIGIFIIGFDNVKEYISREMVSKTEFTIVIPFRNEVKNLPRLLESINALNYSRVLTEFIFIDDESTDDSVNILKTFIIENNQINIKILKNVRVSNSPKKDAISTALKGDSKEWIITTDADCLLPKEWLKTIDDFIQKNECNMVVAPVTYVSDGSFLHQFQLLDFLSLQASTISGFGLQTPFLCNGANLAYKKEIFEKVNGFKNNNSIASGDDIFLLEKFLQLNPDKVKYLKSKNAVVQTFPVNSFKQLVHQRVRWASKTANYSLTFGKIVGINIFAGNSIIVISPLLFFYNIISLSTATSYLILKLFFDYILLEKAGRFHKQKLPFNNYLTSSLLYPFFTIFIVLKSLFSNYNWKGRSFKK